MTSRLCSITMTVLPELRSRSRCSGQPETGRKTGNEILGTRAGIHADGLLKNEEIYNIFDTEKFLNRPVLCAVSNTSGLAGIAHWINTYFHLPEEKKLDKNCELVHEVKKWVDAEYESGRVTVLTDEVLNGDETPYRCCIYKERAILRTRCLAALGFRVADDMFSRLKVTTIVLLLRSLNKNLQYPIKEAS